MKTFHVALGKIRFLIQINYKIVPKGIPSIVCSWKKYMRKKEIAYETINYQNDGVCLRVRKCCAAFSELIHVEALYLTWRINGWIVLQAQIVKINWFGRVFLRAACTFRTLRCQVSQFHQIRFIRRLKRFWPSFSILSIHFTPIEILCFHRERKNHNIFKGTLNGVSIQISLKKKLEQNFYRELSRKQASIEIKVNTEKGNEYEHFFSNIFIFFFLLKRNTCINFFQFIFLHGVSYSHNDKGQ